MKTTLEAMRNELVEKYFYNHAGLKSISIRENGRLRSTLGRYAYTLRTADSKITFEEIQISKDILKEYPQYVKAILCHELIHAWQVNLSRQSGHGASFAREAKRIERESNGEIKNIGRSTFNTGNSVPRHILNLKQQYAVVDGENRINFLKKLTAADKAKIRRKGYSLYKNKGQAYVVTHAKSVNYLFCRLYYEDRTGRINLNRDFQKVF